MAKLSIIIEFFQFLKEKKKWCLLPIALFLLALGAFIVATQGSVVAPFIYALF